jgi:hypothetical protein
MLGVLGLKIFFYLVVLQMRKCIKVGRKNGYFCFFWVMGVSRRMLWITKKHVKKNIAGQWNSKENLNNNSGNEVHQKGYEWFTSHHSLTKPKLDNQ